MNKSPYVPPVGCKTREVKSINIRKDLHTIIQSMANENKVSIQIMTESMIDYALNNMESVTKQRRKR